MYFRYSLFCHTRVLLGLFQRRSLANGAKRMTRLSNFEVDGKSTAGYLAGVSLHSHTNRSKESLHFISKFTEKHPVLHWLLEREAGKSTVPVDLARAYWTPPLPPKAAFEVEHNQIESMLDLKGLVSLTDHDTIEAPSLLRMLVDTWDVPLSLEWSVPFAGTIFHLGIHNLPSSLAPDILSDLRAYTLTPCYSRLAPLLAMLNENPDVLVVFNHPLWDLCGLGGLRHRGVLNQFLCSHAKFVHAFEINATRRRIENEGVIALSGSWDKVLVSGGDRHGCEPSGALNLTRSQSFCEFVREVREENRSHVLIMPQYNEPLILRTLQAVLDVIREYPEFAPESCNWDDRIFHPYKQNELPISALWKAPPAYIERIFCVMRLLERGPVRRALLQIFSGQAELHLAAETLQEATL
jgi:hypothetical protein